MNRFQRSAHQKTEYREQAAQMRALQKLAEKQTPRSRTWISAWVRHLSPRRRAASGQPS